MSRSPQDGNERPLDAGDGDSNVLSSRWFNVRRGQDGKLYPDEQRFDPFDPTGTGVWGSVDANGKVQRGYLYAWSDDPDRQGDILSSDVMNAALRRIAVERDLNQYTREFFKHPATPMMAQIEAEIERRRLWRGLMVALLLSLALYAGVVTVLFRLFFGGRP